MNLAIVMPAYNEAECIEPVVRSWHGVAEKAGGTLIVVNDGSRDDTGKILDRIAPQLPHLKVVHQPNGGHGSAVLNGYQIALTSGADFVFQTDSDNQHLVEDFWTVWAQRESYPFILGIRATRIDTFGRKVISFINRMLNLLLFGVNLHDPNIPFRLMNSGLLRDFLAIMPPDVFAPNIFLSILAAKSGAPLLQTPVTHLPRTTGKVSIVGSRLIKACFRTVGELVRFRWALFRSRAQLATVKARYAVP